MMKLSLSSGAIWAPSSAFFGRMGEHHHLILALRVVKPGRRKVGDDLPPEITDIGAVCLPVKDGGFEVFDLRIDERKFV
jgi:hypothetical protein